MDVDDIKKRLKEMGEEAAALCEMQANVESHMVLQGFFFFYFFGFNFTMSEIMIFFPSI